MAVFRVLLLVVYISSLMVESDYTCTPDEDCIIDCDNDWSNNNWWCGEHTVVNATAATSLTLNCNNGDVSTLTCRYMDIYLPDNTSSSSTITCSDADACAFANIYFLGDATSAPENHNINIICNTKDESCTWMTVNATNAGNVYFECNDITCTTNWIYATNAYNVDINCLSEGSSFGTTSCNSLHVYAEHVSNEVSIKCSGSGGCDSLDVYADFANTLTIYSGFGPMTDGNFYGRNVSSSYDITCISTYYGGSCGKDRSDLDVTKFYLPFTDEEIADKVTLNCYGSGCKYVDLRVHSEDKWSPVGYNGFQNFPADSITFNGCGVCAGNPANCVDDWYARCTDNTRYQGDPLYDSCNRDICGCKELMSKVYDKFMVDIYSPLCSTITPASTVVCNATENCIVDCAQVNVSCAPIIDGFLADTLTVYCNDSNVCADVVIITPNSSSAETNIYCSAEAACSETAIVFTGDATTTDNHEINIFCTINDGSCNVLYVDAPNAGSVRLLCDVECNEASIYANNVGTLSINCDGKCNSHRYYGWNAANITMNCNGTEGGGCDGTILYADNATKVSVIGNANGIKDGAYHGKYVNDLFEIICRSGWNDNTNTIRKGCDNSEFYVSSAAVWKLNCYAYGCNGINLYSLDGFDAVSDDNFVFNGCDQCELGSDLNNCVNEKINVYCGDHVPLTSQSDNYDAKCSNEEFNGTSCSQQSCQTDDDLWQCQCSNVADKIVNVFVNDLSDGNCDDTQVIKETYAPTSDPTHEPSQNPTIDPTHKPTPHPNSISKSNQYNTHILGVVMHLLYFFC